MKIHYKEITDIKTSGYEFYGTLSPYGDNKYISYKLYCMSRILDRYSFRDIIRNESYNRILK